MVATSEIIEDYKIEKEVRVKESTDEVSDVEGLIVGPKGVVDARVPAFVSTHNVVSSGDSAKY